MRLIATTDIHVNLLPHDYFQDCPAPEAPSLARLARLIAAARAEGAASLLLDNGDFLQGTPMAEAHLARAGPRLPHPAIRAMNHLGYDASGLGNHEFNYGLEILDRAVRRARFPVLASNLRFRATEAPPVRPFALIDRQLPVGGALRPVRIGVIAFVPPQILQWDRPHLWGKAEVDDPLTAAPGAIAAARAAGAQIVVALCHSGLAPTDQPYHAEAAGAHLAGLPGIDALICGHSHRLFPLPDQPCAPGLSPATGTVGAGVPCVMPGANGSHLGQIDLTLRPDGAGWAVVDHAARLIAPDGPAAPDLCATLAPDHRATLAHIRRAVGHSQVALHSHFAHLGRSRALSLIAEAQRSAAIEALQAAGSAPDLPLLSAVAPFKAGGQAGPGHFVDIPPGPLRLSHVADLYGFPNELAVIEMTGADLRHWLEHAASIYRQLRPGGGDQPLIDPDFPAYNADMIHGIEVAFDLSQLPRFDRHGVEIHPQARRVAGLSHAGRPIAARDRFLLATNTYRLSGAGGYLVPGRTRAHAVGPRPLQQVLADHLRRACPVAPPPGPGFGLMVPPGARPTLRVAPAALRHLDEIADLSPEPLGLDPSGFRLVRLPGLAPQDKGPGTG